MSQDDFKIEVARGRYPFFRTEHKFGHNANVGTEPETIWSEGGLYTFLTDAVSMTLSSSNANDAGGGTGAQVCTVYGLDKNYKEVVKTLTLNGQNAVTLSPDLLRVNRIIVNRAGSTGYNEGKIYVGTGNVTTGKPATVHASVEVSKNQTLVGMWTVPAGYDAYIENVYFSVGGGFEMEVELYIGEHNETMALKFGATITSDTMYHKFSYPLKVSQKSDIELRASVLSGGVHVDGGFEVLMVKHGTSNNWSG